jgi:hypothetical protein
VRLDREGLDYQACWCEENAWRLAGLASLAALERHVVFVSNAARACAMWAQRAAASAGEPVVWDYHVLVLVRSGSATLALDLDSTAPFPCALEAWVAATFPHAGRLDAALEPRFRVVEASRFLEVFASDRAHMLDERGEYRAAPPPWPPIGAAGAASNLLRFVDVEAAFEGERFDLAGLRARFGRDLSPPLPRGGPARP